MASVRTNNVPRDIINGYDLTEKERKEFDWMDWGEEGDGLYNTFFRYKGNVYATSEAAPFYADIWQGIYSESAFSAVVIRYVNDNEQVVVGQIFS